MLQVKRKKEYNYSYQENKKSKTNKISNKQVFMFIIILLITGGIMVSYICQVVRISHLNYQLSNYKNNLETIQADNQKTKLTLAKNNSLARIESIAREKLGMIEPAKVQIVVLKNKKNKPAEQEIPHNKNKFFAAGLFDSLMESVGTVKAEEMDN